MIAWAEKVREATGEALLIPQEKSAEQGRPYNRNPGSWPKGERVADRFVVLMTPGQHNPGRGKGPNC